MEQAGKLSEELVRRECREKRGCLERSASTSLAHRCDIRPCFQEQLRFVRVSRVLITTVRRDLFILVDYASADKLAASARHACPFHSPAFVFNQSLGQVLLVQLVTSGELLNHILAGSSGALTEPGVSDHVSYRRTDMRLIGQQQSHEVFEWIIEESRLVIPFVSRPELCSLIAGQPLVVCIILGGHTKWRVTGVENEQDDSDREQVHLHALINPLLVYLRSHVAHSSHD